MSVDRLTDPADHFPYKLDHVKALIEENPPAGPEGPDDDRVRVEDYISPAIAEASAAAVEAQAAYLRDPGDATQGNHRAAAARLQAARAEHRKHRTAGPTVVGIRARRTGE